MKLYRLMALFAFVCFSQCMGQVRTIFKYSFSELPNHISEHNDENCVEDSTYKKLTLTFENGFNDSVICIYHDKVILDTFLKTNHTLGVVIKELVVDFVNPKQDIIEIYFLSGKRKSLIKLSPNYKHIYINKTTNYIDLDYSNCDREYY